MEVILQRTAPRFSVHTGAQPSGKDTQAVKDLELCSRRATVPSALSFQKLKTGRMERGKEGNEERKEKRREERMKLTENREVVFHP